MQNSAHLFEVLDHENRTNQTVYILKDFLLSKAKEVRWYVRSKPM